ncbi:thrombopoietin-like isoform X2 [Acipenser oxyrinchus oxyrinchus]|uniref:Thrombopoietin-like isoform X2 n=1 Tax=Acipenser oxyrinchus oxyrinchus TaxID=40147 RepID=A0AAD8D4H0_ACIOX|nr:thrombopoietin-like isoform X2 [Acipenser oxyrinchus oxyrinchus]
MELSRLLLLAAILFQAREMQTSPINFVCKPRAMEEQIERTKGFQDALSQCGIPSLLPQKVTLPNVGFQMMQWEQKSSEVQRNEIISALTMLLEAVQAARSAPQSHCVHALLERVVQNIKNMVLILHSLPLPAAGASEETAQLPKSSLTSSLHCVLARYTSLTRGKLQSFTKETAPEICKGQRR